MDIMFVILLTAFVFTVGYILGRKHGFIEGISRYTL